MRPFMISGRVCKLLIKFECLCLQGRRFDDIDVTRFPKLSTKSWYKYASR